MDIEHEGSSPHRPEENPRRHIIRRVTHLVLLAVAADLVVPLVELSAGLDPIVGFRQRPFLYLYLFAGTVLTFGVFGAFLGSREALLEKMAFRDALTGLYNSRYMHTRLREHLAVARRLGTPTSFVLFDIDHFKKVNDTHGHPVGDQVLQLLGATIRETLREGETAARVGGEEFAMLLPQTSATEAAAAAERIRLAIGQAFVTSDAGQQVAVTASAGVACVIQEEPHSAAELFRLADQALYAAKRQGRNRVVVERSAQRPAREEDDDDREDGPREVSSSKQLTAPA